MVETAVRSPTRNPADKASAIAAGVCLAVIGIAFFNGSPAIVAEPSHVLKAMKVPDTLANSAIRVSFSKTNTMSDVDALLKALTDIIEINRHSSVMMAANV